MKVTVINDPLTLDLVKSHARVYIAEDDAILQSYMESSAAFVTSYTDRASVEYEVEEEFLFLTNPMCLKWKTEVRTATVSYTDNSGVTQSVDTQVYMGNVVRATLPADYDGGKVTIIYTPYMDALKAPIFTQTRLYLIADFYESRETNVLGISVNELPMGTQTMLNNLKSYSA